MKVIEMVSIADAFTLLNALLGFSAILAAFEGELELAYVLVVLGVLADGMDGMVARRFGSKWLIGDFLDIMADTVTFGVAPSVLMYITYREGLGDPDMGLSILVGRMLTFAVGATVITLGVLRLARFCYESEDEESDLYFTGLPIPATALLVVTMLLMGWPGLVVVGFTLVSAMLMVSDLKYPKARGWPSKVTGVLGFLLVITVLAGDTDTMELASEFMMYLTFSATILYQYLGPFAKGSRVVDIIEEAIEDPRQ
jgi:CDP-diacylglycerol--serine O-phosphatidyltransferase